jgi:hypothetical protein
VIAADLSEDGLPVEPTRGIPRVDIISVAAPTILVRSLHGSSTDGIEMNVTAERPVVALLLNKNGLEAALEECAGAAMPSIEQRACDSP